MSHDVRTLSASQMRFPESGLWPRMPLVLGVVGLVAIAISYFLGQGEPGEPSRFFYSYLVAFLFVLSIALGALFLVLVHFATKAGWGVVVRRLAETTAATVPFLAVLFLPVLFGAHDLYHWSHADAVAHDALLEGKSSYLNVGAFLFRAVIYFGLWSLLAVWFLRTSKRQDSSRDAGLTRRMIAVSGPGIIIFALSATYASFDWLMSLDPHWYSTMYGVYWFAGCLVAIMAFLVLLGTCFERSGSLRNVITDEHYHDLGKLLFAFTVFWAYIAFSQYFLIWYANIPEETNWFLKRNAGSWAMATKVLAVAHFFIPFFFLMPRTIKRRRPLLFFGAIWMLAVHYFDLYWQVMPTLDHAGINFSLVDVTALVGVVGVFLSAVFTLLRRGSLVPIGDPRIVESLSFENA